MRRRESTSRRVSPKRRYTVLVYCGAARTEPDYFNGLKRHLRSQTVTVKIRYDGVAPKQLVRIAATYRDKTPGAYDEVWCVVDTDEFDIDAALAEARRRGVSLAVSNPCFELWLLLHHDKCTSHCTGYADVAGRLRKHVPGYDKARLDFADYAAGVDDATARAKALGVDHAVNPSTGVWRLVETIREKP
ncbi:RloB family protein [Phytohabitans aurantiacus]|uniref:RloB-like protein n=1 Tax=Phytohabitans aurantiacus TaxID=3016789 RepID=A0ABQ5R002_9ACTN|nr:RloB family protein [Phytohabitans aurantiacus]GLH99201.1 hypothetical protein Pa4123_44760 [Phytohabitans aurantiacus]